jgi:hypothetical protein
MQLRNSDPQRWYLVPVNPGAEASFRRWNLVIILFLAMLVLGLFLPAIVPQRGSRASATSKVPLKIDKDPAPVNLAVLR